MSIHADRINKTKALEVFDSIPRKEPSIVSIGSMMAHCINHNKNDKAISMDKQYKCEHNRISNLSLMTACSNVGDINNVVNTFSNIPKNKKDMKTIGAMMLHQ